MIIKLIVVLSLLFKTGFTVECIYPFEEVNLVQTPFPGQYATCRGTTVEGVHKVECAAICYDATSPVWGVKGYFPHSLYFTNTLSEDCYVFLFNNSYRYNTGSCTICFEETAFPEILELNNVMATFIYATPTVFCK